MKIFFTPLALLFSCFCFADFSDHIKKDDRKKTCQNSIGNIDFIYLINLDKRPEKFKKSIDQLKPYEIVPYRFSAVYGWDLSVEAKNDLGVIFSPKMIHNQWVNQFPPNLKGTSGAPRKAPIS